MTLLLQYLYLVIHVFTITIVLHKIASILIVATINALRDGVILTLKRNANALIFVFSTKTIENAVMANVWNLELALNAKMMEIASTVGLIDIVAKANVKLRDVLANHIMTVVLQMESLKYVVHILLMEQDIALLQRNVFVELKMVIQIVDILTG